MFSLFKTKIMKQIKRFFKWYMKKYAENYGKLIEIGMNPNL